MIKVILFITILTNIVNANTKDIEKLQKAFQENVIEVNVFRKRYEKFIKRNCDDNFNVWMSHGDSVSVIPEHYELLASTDSCKYAAVKFKNIYGIQFHREVVHTEQGTEILKNSVLKVCGAKQEWTMEGFIDTAVEKISKIEGNVLCGVSGGIDSTVVALLIDKAIGNRLKCVFVDNGLLRLNEEKEVEEMFKENFKVNFTSVNAGKQFLEKLKGIEDPEAKRKIVGEEFIHVFTNFAEKEGPFKWLAQGTLYPDVIESGVSKGPASVIKSHHNVGGLPDWLNLEILEPLRELYKDEVRYIAKILGVPEKLFMRHPFPGPGLSVRIIGEVTPTKLQISKIASKIVEEELMETSELYPKSKKEIDFENRISYWRGKVSDITIAPFNNDNWGMV